MTIKNCYAASMLRVASVLTLIFAYACAVPPTAEGLGRPSFQNNQHSSLSGISLREIYLGGGAYVEIASQKPVDLAADYHLCSAFNRCVDFAANIAIAAPALYVEYPLSGADLNTLSLSPQVGQLALVKKNSEDVQAFLAWGAPADTATDTLALAALRSGAYDLGAFAALPFPVQAGFASVVSDDYRGCVVLALAQGRPLPQTLPDLTLVGATACAPSTPVLRITEVVAPWFGPADSFVELHNVSAAPLNLDFVRLCAFRQCLTLPAGSAALAAGNYILLHLGALSGATANVQEIIFAAAEALPQDGDITLLGPGDAVLDEDSYVFDHVRYGAGSPWLSALAVAKGLWPALNQSVAKPAVLGESLRRSNAACVPGVACWSAGPASLGIANP